MLRSFKIGEYIFNRIKTITGYDCYPCVADNDVKFPYIVYNRNGLSTQLTKDGYSEDTISFEISIYSDKYAQTIEVAEAVRNALETLSTTYDKYFELNNSIITNASEYWESNTYIQNINWSADVTRYVEYELKPTVTNIKFGIHSKYSYDSISGTGDWELDLNTSLDTGAKHVRYVTSSVDPYVVPITIWQNNYDVTDECTFSFPSGRNVSMDYDDHKLTFRLLSLQNTYFKTNVEITKDDKTVEIPFEINYVGTNWQLFPQMNSSNIFDYTSYDAGRVYGKAVGTDNITANGLKQPVYIDIENDAPWPLNFGSVTVKEPKPEPTYNEWQDLSNITFGRQGVNMYINMGDTLNSQLWGKADFSGGSFVVTDQMATDDTFTTFTKAIQANAYYSVSSLHNRMYKTTSSPESTFITNYDYSNVDHVDLKLQICTDNNSGLTNIHINGVVLDDYITEQYGADWKNTVNWVRQTITFYNYRNDTSYSTVDRTCYHCCYLELTNIPVEVITNLGTTTDKLTGFTTSSASNSALFYNFKFIRKQNS